VTLADELAGSLFADVSVIVCVADDAQGVQAEAELVSAERALVARAVPGRVRAFALGRYAAKQALVHAGAPPGPLLAGRDRAPLWPKGFVGSIAHTTGIAVAVAARAEVAGGLGVDVEKAIPLSAELWERVLVPTEHAALLRAPADHRGRLALRVFCAKEAVYKAWSGVGQRVLEFHEVEVDPLPGDVDLAVASARVLATPRAQLVVRVMWHREFTVASAILGR
jgi:4'-phosphopantetheinyl transferase EntD